MAKFKETPPVLAAQNTKQKYHRPSFEVIGINMESNLLAGSGTPTSKNLPKVPPIKKGDDW